MKNLKLLTLVVLLIVIVALVPAFARQQEVELQVTTQNLRTVGKFEALSIKLQSLPREERLAYARAAATELGSTFLEPNSVEGRRFINLTIVKRIVQIYASDLPVEEKREQARKWAADADAQIEFVPDPEPQAFNKPGKKKKKRFMIQDFECSGRCSNFTILEGSGCILSCQQNARWDLGFGMYIEYCLES